MGTIHSFITFIAGLSMFAIGLLAAAIVVIYIIDRTQTSQTVRRNFPVIGAYGWLENLF